MIYIFQDWHANSRNPKGRLILFLFRIAGLVSIQPRFLRIIFLPYIVFYRIFVEWLLGVELPWKLRVGPGLRLYHGQALVVNDRVAIGENCTLRHSTTIGVAYSSASFDGDAPLIGNNVDIGSNVVIIGGVRVGDNVTIGSGSVVVKDIPANSVVVGNPARIVRMKLL